MARRYLLVVGRVGSLETEANAAWAVPILEDEISTPERRMQELEEWAAEIALTYSKIGCRWLLTR